MRTLLSRSLSLAVSLAAAIATGCGGHEPASTAADSAVTSDELRARSGGTPSVLPQTILCIGSAEELSGVVAAVGTPGDGLTIDTGDAVETVFGLGPTWYWRDNGVDRPVVGDAVTLVVSHVTTTDARLILSVTLGGQTLELRNPATCAPLWSGRR